MACIETMANARSADGDFVDADLRFLVAVADASGNPMMRSPNALIEVALAITFAISSPIPNSAAHARMVTRHRAIAAAIEAKDTSGARLATRSILREVEAAAKQSLSAKTGT